MTDTNETIADIIAEIRRDANVHCSIPTKYLNAYANRLEAAHRREMSKNVSKNGADFGQLGDVAKLRAALEKCADWGEQIDHQLGSSDETVYTFRGERCLAHNISECARAALAAPATTAPMRNCDVLKLKEGHPGDIADQVWRAYKQSHMGSYLDVCDLLRCIGWLFSPATEKEGGSDGNE